MPSNLYPNSRFLGAVAGVVGSGGALPDGGQKSGQAGYTVEVVSVYNGGGYQVLRLKLNYNNTSGSDQFVNVEFGDYPAYGNGFPGLLPSASVATQVFLQVISGTFPSFCGYNWIDHQNDGTYISNLIGAGFDASATNYQNIAVTSALSARMNLQAYVFVPNTANLIDGVIDIAKPMVETGTTWDPWIGTPVQPMAQIVC